MNFKTRQCLLELIDSDATDVLNKPQRNRGQAFQFFDVHQRFVRDLRGG